MLPRCICCRLCRGAILWGNKKATTFQWWLSSSVGITGFEPVTPNSRSWCANRTALHPDDHLYMPIRGSDFFRTSALLVLVPLFFDGLCLQLSLGPLLCSASLLSFRRLSLLSPASLPSLYGSFSFSLALLSGLFSLTPLARLPHFSAPWLRPCLVGITGFEPVTPCSQSRCANRTAPHPVVLTLPQQTVREITI